MGSAPGEVAPVVSKVRHRACGNTCLDLEVKESTTYDNTNIRIILLAKMARDAQDRAHMQSESGDEDLQNHHQRRETLLQQTAPTLRIWELNHLSEIEEWEE